MHPRSFDERVEILERTVEGLSGLPDRVTAVAGQILELRTEMHSGFSAMGSEFAAVRNEMRAGDDDTRRQMRVLHEDAISRIGVIAEGHEETQRQVSVLRDEVGKGFDQVAMQFDQVAKQFDQVAKQFDQVEKQFDRVARRFDEIATRLDSIDRRLAPRRNRKKS